jgi:hypothetical protein
MKTTDFLLPLNRLIFGQEDGEGINARTTGRLHGIPELAVNLRAVAKAKAERDTKRNDNIMKRAASAKKVAKKTSKKKR